MRIHLFLSDVTRLQNVKVATHNFFILKYVFLIKLAIYVNTYNIILNVLENKYF